LRAGSAPKTAGSEAKAATAARNRGYMGVVWLRGVNGDAVPTVGIGGPGP
jgi:hypothetical protein